MLNKAIDHLLPNYEQLKNRTVFLWLFFVSFFIRFPFIFRDYIDRDESTFILVGQAWVDGYLPYTELWDLKPPLTFLFFAGIIFLFGKSLIAIRIAGIIVVAVISWFTYKIGSEISSKKISFWASVLSVFLISMFGSLQGVMSEHLSMLFFMPAVYLLIKYRDNPQLFLAGILLGAAVMTKINLAYPVLFLGIFLLFGRWLTNGPTVKLPGILLLVTGGLITIGLTILPYYLQGQTELWWKAVVLAPLEYSGARRHSLGRFAPLLLFVATLLIYTYKKRIINYKDPRIQLLLVTILGVILAFIRGGRINGHYLIQLHPLLIILVCMAVASLKIWNWNYRPLALLLLIAMPSEAYLEYYAITDNKRQYGTFLNGEGYTVPQFIEEEELPLENIFFLEYHIGYWFLDLHPPTKAATHPTNLCRDETFVFFDNPRKTSMDELRYILEEKAPEIVITRNRWHVFDKKEEEQNAYVRAYLEAKYNVVKEIDEAEIHRRSE